MTEQELDAFAEKGDEIYNRKLKAHLEPEQNGRMVAIHLDTEDFALGRTSHEAVHTLRLRHPQGRLVIMSVGSEPDYALASRLLAGQMKAGIAK